MNFNRDRADRDTLLYNTDGRQFDLVETDQKLELRARPDAHPMLIFISLTSGGVSLLASKGLSGWTLLQINVFVALVSMLNWLILLEMAQFFGFYDPDRWILDKEDGSLCADAKKLAPLTNISRVRCFKLGRRFKLVLVLRNGREFHIGAWRFGRQEWAWRQDAAQIAAFLNVPLEIPPVLDHSVEIAS